MPSYPSFLLPDDSVKIRFREPFASQALNMKTDGIVPPGIYNGFTPNVDMATPDVLLLNTDPYRNDSVAVGDVYNLNGAIWTADYNLTIRTTLQVQLDFTGHTVFPCWVVLRPAYSIVAHPFSGLTNAQVVTINTLTVNDNNALALHHGDIKICRVNSVGPVVPVITPNGAVDYSAPTTTSRNDNGGSLVTQVQVNGSLISLPFTKIAYLYTAAPTYDGGTGLYTDTVISFTTTVLQDLLVDLQCGIGYVTDGTSTHGMVLDYVNPGSPGTTGATKLSVTGGSFSSGITAFAGIEGCTKIIFPAVAIGAHTIRMKLLGASGSGGAPYSYMGIVYYK